MFTSDNGYLLGEHRLRMGKTLPYEPALRVPLLVAGPEVPQGERFDPVKTADLSATILDLAHARAPHPADGLSMRDNFRNGDRGWRVPVLTEALVIGPGGVAAPAPGATGFPNALTTVGVRTARYKLIRWATGAVELYDLARDPHELRNVAALSRYGDVRRRLTAVWWHLYDCRAASCARPLPRGLSVGPERLATLTRRQADLIEARSEIDQPAAANRASVPSDDFMSRR
jgi:arylsulfatase A-like enzyme